MVGGIFLFLIHVHVTLVSTSESSLNLRLIQCWKDMIIARRRIRRVPLTYTFFASFYYTISPLQDLSTIYVVEPKILRH